MSLRTFVGGIQKKALIYGSAVGGVLGLLWSWNIGLGLIAGVCVSVVNFQLMAVDAFDMVDKRPRGARRFIIGRYALRYVIMFGFIALVAVRTDWNVFAAFAGLFFVQGVLVADQAAGAVRKRNKRQG